MVDIRRCGNSNYSENRSLMDHGPATDTREILGDLRRLGFTESEARVYVALIGRSPATAYEISNRSGVPRPNTYSILKTLAAKHAVIP